MAFFKVQSLQLALGAAVLSMAAMAGAQTEAAKPAGQPAAMDAAGPAMKKQHHRHHHKGQRPMRDSNSSSREAMAASAEAKKGKLDDGQGMSQYQRNAYARCGVFKTEIDQQACMARVKDGAVSGSVKDGGILREITVEEVIR
ncbi:MAG: hypothetical protein E2583_14110 [Comamonas sp.]|nr:hypothetical protein [Comamonas sp.]